MSELAVDELREEMVITTVLKQWSIKEHLLAQLPTVASTKTFPGTIIVLGWIH